MEVSPPSFPLGANHFAAALRSGHGRAVQQVERHESRVLEDKIIEACLASLSYDPQCEAARAPWLFSIVEHAKLNTQVLQAIETAIRTPPPENHRNMAHRSAILKQFASAGSSDARRLLYSSLARSSHTATVFSDMEILALDGEKGLIHVARQLGRWVQDDPDFCVDDDIVEQFNELTGTEQGLVVLQREAEVDADIAHYLAGVHKTKASIAAAARPLDVTAFSGEAIIAHVKNQPRDQCHWFRRWAAQAQIDQLEMVFAALLAAQEPEDVKRLFRCFARIGAPRFEQRLSRWLTDANHQVQWAAIRALAPLTHPELREIGKRLIAGGDLASGAALLVNNFDVSDFDLCARNLALCDDSDENHHLAMEVLTLCEAHPCAEALECLLFVYEYSPCSTCRRGAVKALIELNIAPLWLRAESAFDADPETRALACP